ncbi:MAG: acyl-CoA synthetase [Pseudomonadota bacterium]|nr:acyl-CoA synthetase [Pseudomonadota bacterium]
MSATDFWTWAAQQPQRLALVTPEYDEYSFGALAERVNQVSHGLRALGLVRGDTISMVMHNCAEWVELALAVQQLGLYLTPINFHLTGPEIAYIIENSESKAFFAASRYAEATAKAVEQLSFDRNACFVVDGAIAGFRPFEELWEDQPTTAPERRAGGSMMLYTSGTTGRPKGVRKPLPETGPEEAAASSALLASLFDIQAGVGAHLCAGPLYHAAPGGFGIGALHLGQTLVLMDKWTPEGTLERIDRYRITASHMVPTMFIRMLDVPDEEKRKYDVSSLTNVIHAAAPCPEATKHRMIEWFGPVIYEYYAATEGGGTYCNAHEWLEHPGTVGKPWPGSEVAIFDDEGNELPPGEIGTIYMRSPMGEFEYYKDEEKTAKSRMHGMFTVGDMGFIDQDGWLFIRDRKIDMVITGGVNIYPAEIEAVLVQQPLIRDVAVFGIPDDEKGEVVKAVVELHDGVEPNDSTRDAIMQYVGENLAKYKWPRSIDFIDALPRLPTGKLYKRFLRDKYWEGRERAV